MALFLIAFLTLYTGVHLVVFLRIRILFAGLRYGALAPALFMGLMVASPVLVRIFENLGHERLAQATAWIGYSWMGFVFLCFVGSLATGFYDLLAKSLLPGGWILPGRLPALVVLAVSLCLCVYGYFEARNIRIESVRFQTDKLPPGMDTFRIVQISDVHLGLLVRQDRLKRIVEKIRSLSPDLLVSTGDLVDGQMSHLDGISDLLAGISPPFGKFAITGNHEVYAGLSQALEFTQKCGFELLRGEVREVGEFLRIAGVDDDALGGRVAEPAFLSKTAEGRFTLFLKHRPAVSPESVGLFDLQLSGHTHRGQIFPFRYLVGLSYPMLDGFYDLPKGAALYTSRGTGTWGPPIRVFSPPEVTLIELVREGRRSEKKRIANSE